MFSLHYHIADAAFFEGLGNRKPICIAWIVVKLTIACAGPAQYRSTPLRCGEEELASSEYNSMFAFIIMRRWHAVIIDLNEWLDCEKTRGSPAQDRRSVGVVPSEMRRPSHSDVTVARSRRCRAVAP